MKVLVMRGDRVSYWLWCPACDHAVRLDDGWAWDGDLERPTFSPSLLTRYAHAEGEIICHAYLKGGVWSYLADSTHERAGQQLPAVDLPDWMIGRAIRSAG